MEQVVIVGGGPVGLGLAIELGQRGVGCVVVERYATPLPIPRGQNLTQRTMEHMWSWGCENALRAARTVPASYGIGGLTAYGTLLSDYHYDWMQRELVRPFYLTDNERLPQYATEAVLRARVAELSSVRVVYGWRAEGVSQDEAGVRVEIAEREGVGREVLRGDFVVGCDGARSVVREAAGITQTRSDHDKLMVLLVFRSTGLHELLAKYPGKSFYCVLTPELAGYWQFFGRVDLGSTWFFHAPVPMGTTAENYDFVGLLHRAVGAAFNVEMQHVGFWDLRFAVADTYRNGRMFIAGDAAHSHPPYGGYGINTGFEDARNLGWKLAAVLQGWGGEGLLDTYSDERQPVFASTARDFIEKGIHADRDFLAAYDPARDLPAFEARWAERGNGAVSEVGAFEPHYEPSGASAVGRHEYRARVGHHLTPMALSDGRSVFEALGDGFSMLALDAEPGGFAEAGVSVVRDSRDGGRERYGAGLVLVRPDQFVAWVGDEAPDDAGRLLEAVSGAYTKSLGP